MRIVGGSLGGRVLRAPTGAATRPTSEKVREAMFAILGPVDGLCVLDLFAGSGAVGIEALSRGAAHATFCDSAKPALDALRANLAALALTDRATVIASDAPRYAARIASPPWGFVFVDPPYASDLAVRAIQAIPVENFARGAKLVVEHDRRHAPPEALGSLLRTDHRRYGDTLLSFYEATP
jgi:16S rRNA (guanine966-N2)-methyltransferase